MLGAVVATVAGIAGLRAQTQLADPKDAQKIFASTCSACHKSPQGLAKSGQVAGFLRQHYTTGPEMSAAMAAYLVAAGSAPAKKGSGEDGRGRQPPSRRQRARPGSRSRPRPSRARTRRSSARCAASSCRRSRRTSETRQPPHPSRRSPSPASATDAAARQATAAAPGRGAVRAAGRDCRRRARDDAAARWRSTFRCRSCRRLRRPTSLSRLSRPRPCPDRRPLPRASRRTPRHRPPLLLRRVCSRRCVTFSPRAWRSASSALRATLIVIVTSTSGCSATGTVCRPIVLIGSCSWIWLRSTVKPPSVSERGDVARRDRAEQLADVGRLAHHDEALAVELAGDDVGVLLQFEIARFELRLHALELGAVVLGGPKRLALRQQEIAREAVLHADDFAHLAELGDTLQQDHFHLGLSVVRMG